MTTPARRVFHNRRGGVAGRGGQPLIVSRVMRNNVSGGAAAKTCLRPRHGGSVSIITSPDFKAVIEAKLRQTGKE